jgi:hypothetical protein
MTKKLLKNMFAIVVRNMGIDKAYMLIKKNARIKLLRILVTWYLLIKICYENDKNFEILKMGKSILDILKMSIFEKGQIKISKNCVFWF